MKEIIEKFNQYKVLGDFEDFIEKNNEELKDIFAEYEFKRVRNLDTDEHRWYCVDTNVYEVRKKSTSEKIGNFACDEVGTIKSEMMGSDDCGIETTFYEVEEIQELSYKIKNEEGE